MSDYNMSFQQVTPCPAGASTYTIRPGDTLYALARRYGTTVQAIMALNPGLDPNSLRVAQIICIPGVAGQPPAPSCPNGTLYAIQPGDSLYRLATRFGVSVPALIAANPGVDPSRLTVGQQICIPGAVSSPGQRVRTPCCATLAIAPGAPAGAMGENPTGVILVRQIAMSTRSLTFSAAGLGAPSRSGNYNAYLGILHATGEPPANLPVTLTAVLGPVTGAAGQPTTWSGSSVTTIVPAVNDLAEIRLFNSAMGVRGPAVLSGTLVRCGR